MSSTAAAVAGLAMAQGLDPNVHLSPALPGARVNESPTFGDLARDPGAWGAWEERLRQVHRQLVTRAIGFGEDAAGWHLALPPAEPAGSETRLSTLANDASAAAVPVWVSAQFDDPTTGSWGAQIRGSGENSVHFPLAATVFRYAAGSWRPAAAGQWSRARGRFERLTPALPSVVANGLARAVLRQPKAAGALVEGREGPWFGGNGGWDRTPDPDTALAVELAALSSCTARRVSSHRYGTKARTEAERRAAHAYEVARGALDDVCGAGADPVVPGSACDRTLDALHRYGSPPCDVAPSPPPCPRVVSPAELSAWREGSMPAHGPYETPRPHDVGSTPCCYFHPATQKRLALQRAVYDRLAREAPGASEAEAATAIAEAEAAHPLAETWARCDEEAREAGARFGASGVGGRGAESGVAAFVAFYNALRGGETGAARGIWSSLASEYPALSGEEMPLDPGDPLIWDVAHRAAHDSGNKGYVLWAHNAMEAQGLTVTHDRRRSRRNDPLGEVRAAGAAVALATATHAALRGSDDLAALARGSTAVEGAQRAAAAAMADATQAGFSARDVQRAYDTGVAS